MTATANQLERAALLISERSRLTRIVSYWARGGKMRIRFVPNDDALEVNVTVEEFKDQEAVINILLARNCIRGSSRPRPQSDW